MYYRDSALTGNVYENDDQCEVAESSFDNLVDQRKNPYSQPVLPFGMFSGPFGHMNYPYPYPLYGYNDLRQEKKVHSEILRGMTRAEKMVTLARSGNDQL